MNRSVTGAAAFAMAVTVAAIHAQVGRGTTEWLTAGGDAQRTYWIRTDPKISVASMSKPGFDLQWTRKLDNRVRGANGLQHGVSGTIRVAPAVMPPGHCAVGAGSAASNLRCQTT